jgi:hypothetical protein
VCQECVFTAFFLLFSRPIFTVFGLRGVQFILAEKRIGYPIGYPNGYPRNLHNWGKILQKRGEIDVICNITH